MTPPREPRTTAGRALLADIVGFGAKDSLPAWQRHIAAIEAEAEAAGAPLREALDAAWDAWLLFNEDATKKGSGFTRDQMNGAAGFHSFLRDRAALTATPAPAPLDDSHSFPACMVCGAYLSDPEASEPCVPVTAQAAATEDTE